MLSNLISRSTAAFGGAPFPLKRCTAIGSAGAGSAGGAAANRGIPGSLVVKVRDKLTRCIRNNKPEVYKLNLLQQKCKYSLTDISLLFKIPITTNITSATVR